MRINDDMTVFFSDAVASYGRREYYWRATSGRWRRVFHRGVNDGVNAPTKYAAGGDADKATWKTEMNNK